MKQVINVLSLLAIVAAPVAIGSVLTQTHAKTVIVATATLNQNFPLNQAKSVEFEKNTEGFQGLTNRQKLDQLRDWLLLTVLSGAGLSARDTNQATYDLPTIRYGYTKPVSNLEYGETRSLYIGNGKVIALIPKGRSVAARADDLAHIADRHRKDLGKIPTTLIPFEYEIDQGQTSAQLTQRDAIKGQNLFTAEAGYQKARISNVSDLERFIGQIDDLTSAQLSNDTVVLGGRKLKNRAAQNIRVEDVAALWQSEQNIQAKLESFYGKWDQKIATVPDKASTSQINGDCKNPLDLTCMMYNPQSERDKLIQQAQEERRKLNLVNGSGFSLDPDYEYPALQEKLKQAKPLLNLFKQSQTPIVSDAEIEQTSKALSNRDIVPYLKLIDKLKQFNQSKQNQEALWQSIKAQLKPEIEALKSKAEREIDAALTAFEQQAKQEIQSKALQLQKSDNPAAARAMIDALSQQKQQEFEQIKTSLVQQKNQEINQVINQKGTQKQDQIDAFLQSRITGAFQSARYDGDLKGTEVGMVLFYTDLLAKLWGFNYLDSTPSQAVPDFVPKTKLKVSSIYQKELEKLSSTRLWFGTQDRGFQVANEGKDLLFARNATRIFAASSDPLNPGQETAANAVSESFLGWWNDHYEEVARYEPQYERLNQIMKWSMIVSWLNQAKQGNALDFLKSVSVKRDNWFVDWAKAQGDRLKFRQWQQIGFFKLGEKGTKTETLPLLTSERHQLFGNPNWYLSGGVSLADTNLFKGRKPIPAVRPIDDIALRADLNYSSIKSTNGKTELKTLNETLYNLENLTPNLSINQAQAKDGTKFRSLDAELSNQPFTRKVSQDSDRLQIETEIGATPFGSFEANKIGNGFEAGFTGRDIDKGYILGQRLSRDQRPLEVVLKETPDVQTIYSSPGVPGVYWVKQEGVQDWMKISEVSAGGGSGGGGKPPLEMRVGDFEGKNPRNLRLSWDKEQKVKQLVDKGDVKQVYAKAASTERDGVPPFTVLDEQFNRGGYRAVADKIAGDPNSFSFKKHLDDGLKRVNLLLKSNNDRQALRQIKNLLKLHGMQPKLRIQKVIAEIRLGRADVELVGTAPTKETQNYRLDFFDEVNKLLENNLEVKHYVSKDGSDVYVQDNPGLNNMDWTVPIDDRTMGNRSGARAYKVTPGDVGDTGLNQGGRRDGGGNNKGNSGDGQASPESENSPQARIRFRPTEVKVAGEECNRTDDPQQSQQDSTPCPPPQKDQKPFYIVIATNPNEKQGR